MDFPSFMEFIYRISTYIWNRDNYIDEDGKPMKIDKKINWIYDESPEVKFEETIKQLLQIPPVNPKKPVVLDDHEKFL